MPYSQPAARSPVAPPAVSSAMYGLGQGMYQAAQGATRSMAGSGAVTPPSSRAPSMPFTQQPVRSAAMPAGVSGAARQAGGQAYGAMQGIAGAASSYLGNVGAQIARPSLSYDEYQGYAPEEPSVGGQALQNYDAMYQLPAAGQSGGGRTGTRIPRQSSMATGPMQGIYAGMQQAYRNANAIQDANARRKLEGTIRAAQVAGNSILANEESRAYANSLNGTLANAASGLVNPISSVGAGWANYIQGLGEYAPVVSDAAREAYKQAYAGAAIAENNAGNASVSPLQIAPGVSNMTGADGKPMTNPGPASAVGARYEGGPSPESMARWGVTPYSVALGQNRTYDNVAPELQGTTRDLKRAQVANAYDPQSWYNLGSTPAEQEARAIERAGNVGARYESRIRQDQGSPLASPGLAGGLNALAAQEQAQRKKAEDEYTARVRAGQARERQQDVALVGRANPGIEGPRTDESVAAEASQIKSDLAQLNAEYYNYLRGNRRTGEDPMSFQEFTSARMANGRNVSQGVQNITGANYQDGLAAVDKYGNPNPTLKAGRLAGQAENNKPAVYNPYAAQRIARIMGGPVILPQDQEQRSKMIENYAVSGNPFAYGLQREYADQSGQNYRTDAVQQGLMDRAKEENATKPLTVNERLGLTGNLFKIHPENVAQEAVQTRIDQYKEMGYSDEQMKTAAVQQDIRNAGQRAYQQAIPQYQAAIVASANDLPPGVMSILQGQDFGLNPPPGMAQGNQGAQASSQGAQPAPGQTQAPGALPAASTQPSQGVANADQYQLGIPSAPTVGQGTAMDREEADYKVVADLIMNNPNMTMEELNAALAGNGLRAPIDLRQIARIHNNTGQMFPDRNDPVILDRQRTIRNWLSNNGAFPAQQNPQPVPDGRRFGGPR